MADPLEDLLTEHADLEAPLADPSVHADPATARELGRRYAEIGPTVAAAHERDALRGDLEAARELGMAEEAAELEEQVAASRALHLRVAELSDVVTELLLPPLASDGRITARALAAYRNESL